MMNTEAGGFSVVAEVVGKRTRSLREREGLSLGDLAERAGLAKSTLSVLESGQGNPNIETLWAIARALKVPFGRLVDLSTEDSRVVRRGDGTRIDTGDKKMSAHLLISRSRRGAFEMYDVELAPGLVRHAEPHVGGTTEHILVRKGSLRTGTATAPVELRAGDLGSFRADVPHIYQAHTTVLATVMMDYA
jgi:transcriptional regulator with XRE-family HTH domain